MPEIVLWIHRGLKCHHSLASIACNVADLSNGSASCIHQPCAEPHNQESEESAILELTIFVSEDTLVTHALFIHRKETKGDATESLGVTST